MNGDLEGIIHGSLLGDASIRIWKNKYLYYKHTAKDKQFLEWLGEFFNKLPVTVYILKDNPGTHALGFYIKTNLSELLELRRTWYKEKNGKVRKVVPENLELNPNVILHWYLGDGSLQRDYKGGRKPKIILATNAFGKEDIVLLIEKLRILGLNFYPNPKFRENQETNYVLVSSEYSALPFFKIVGLSCPKEIANCITGRKGRGSKLHYFRDKWPTHEDWLRVISNESGIGKILKQRRLELGMSQDHLAKKAGVGRNAIKRIERGVRWPSVALFRRYLNILDINSLYLLERLNK
jgi:DNA-binding XRE family transcriptional regulator